MANMNFGVNILPKANNTYTLGNSDYKWNIFANTLNGVSLTNVITDIQIDGTSIVNNNIATIPIAGALTLGLVKLDSDYGISANASGRLYLIKANSTRIKEGTSSYFPITPYNQHESVFYGLAKAAGDSTQSASSNAVGTYTDTAKTAIQSMLGIQYDNALSDSSTNALQNKVIKEELDKKISITSDTVTGNPCTFNSDVEDIPLKSIKLEYEFSQSGSGDPSPTNVRPITGISDFFIAHTKKNMAMLRGYSAANRAYNIASVTTNNYGTTINTTDPESSVTITQSSTPRSDNLSHYENGYICIRTDNMVDGQYYDVSFKVTNITSNPLNASLSNWMIMSGQGSGFVPSEVKDDVVIMKNLLYREAATYRQGWEVRICGMSCTVSEFMVTPANTNDGIYEPYEGTVKQYTFPAFGKNLCPPPVKGISVNGDDGSEATSATRATTDYIPIDFITNTNYRFSGMPNTLTMWASGYNANKEFVGRTSSDKRSAYTISSNSFNQGSPTHTGDIAFIRLTFSAGSGASIDDVDSSSIQLEVGDTATAYEPYCNTVYGGSLDLVSGVLNVTYGCYTFTGNETFNHLETKTSLGMERHIFNTNILDNYAARNSQSSFCASTAVRTGIGGSSNPFCFYNGTPTNQFAFYIDSSLCEATVDSFKAWLAEHPCQVVFPLKEPFNVQLTPEQIKTFKGINTIWANTNGPIEIENHIDLETIKEYADNVAGIQDVQINGTSIVNNSVANIPPAGSGVNGYCTIDSTYGINANSAGRLYIQKAASNSVKGGTGEYRPIVPYTQHESVFYGLAKAAGDSTQAASDNAVGVYTNSAKTAIQSMLGITSMTGATSSVAGTSGLVPAPTTSDTEKFLRGDGTWATPKVFIAEYGVTTFPELVAARNNQCLVFCKVLTDSTSYRYAPLSFNSSNFEFHYYKPASNNEVDEMYIYKINGTSGWETVAQEIVYNNVLEYGVSTWNDYETARRKNKNKTNGIFLKVQNDSGNYRYVTLSYVYGNTAEFNYYSSSSTANNPDKIIVYKLTKTNDEWSYTERTVKVDVMVGATSSANGIAGSVPAPTTADVNKFLSGDGTWKFGEAMTILSYGTSTWAQFLAAYQTNSVVYCRASSNSNPATGSQTRLAFMAYVNDESSPTNVEFQYYRSMSSHSATAMGDEVYVYKLTNANGGTWSVTSRPASIKEIKAGTNEKIGVSWNNNVVTLSNTMTANDMPMSSSDATTAKSAIDTINTKLGSTTMGTTATTVTGAIAEHESDISTLNGKIANLVSLGVIYGRETTEEAKIRDVINTVQIQNSMPTMFSCVYDNNGTCKIEGYVHANKDYGSGFLISFGAWKIWKLDYGTLTIADITHGAFA